jgi:hypothetical protein
MKNVYLPICFLLVSSFVFGQAREGMVDFQKTKQPAAVIELPYHPDIVNAAMKDHLSKKGKSKGVELKGFTMYRNTQPLEQAGTNADLYFRVERKSRQEKETSLVSLLLNAPKEGSEANVHYLSMEQAISYLNELAPAIEAYQLELQIKEQNERVIKAESKYQNLANETKDLEKKKADIEKKIEATMNEVNAQTSEIEAQKQKLSVLVSQRKS